MHFENFYDHEMRPLTPKLFFARDVKKRNKVLYHGINGSDIKKDSALSHNLNSKALNTPAIRDIINIIEKGRMHSNLKTNAL